MSLRLSALASVFPVQGAVLLIVDDAIENTSQLALLLRAVGCTVHTANSAAEAQKVLAEVIPDVILLDIVMPEQDGLSFCEELKRDPRIEPVSIVFLSGLHDVKDKLRAFAVGGADFVTKPFDPTEVIARVSHQFRLIKMRKALLAEREQLLIANRQLQRSRQETVEVFEVLAEQLQGKTLDKKYRLEELIGTGGSAMVYRATQLQIQRAVAVKIMRPCGLGRDQKQNERFHAETTLAAKLQHPHIPVLIDAAVSSDGLRYIVMELLRGSPLSDVLRSSGPMAPDRCLEVMMPIVCAVAHAHRHGILHRDIKPSKIPSVEKLLWNFRVESEIVSEDCFIAAPSKHQRQDREGTCSVCAPKIDRSRGLHFRDCPHANTATDTGTPVFP